MYRKTSARFSAFAVTLLLASCGRFGFDSHPLDGGAASDAGPTIDLAVADLGSDGPDAATPDAAPQPVDGGPSVTPAFVIEPSTPIAIFEFDSEATFTIRLASVPSANVFVLLASSDTSEASVSPTSLAFTPENALSAQTVTVTGVNDSELDGNQPFTIVTTNATAAGDYVGVEIADIEGMNGDDESPGIVVVADDNLETEESGTSVVFSVRLQSAPTSDVHLPVVSADPGEVMPSSAELVFNNSNWDMAQVVTLTGVDDAVADGDQTTSIHVGPSSSAQPGYDGIVVPDISVTNVDDEQARLVVPPRLSLTTTEGGVTATFSVRLGTVPTADVTLSITSDDTSEGIVSAPSLTFTPSNGTVPQSVTITGVDDAIADGNQSFSVVVHVSATADPVYAVVADETVHATNIDNETSGITVTAALPLTTSEAGGTDTFSIVLNSQPTATVSIAFSPDAPTEGTLSPSTVIFTPANWNVPQIITVTGVDDAVHDGDHMYYIFFDASTSADSNYNGLSPPAVAVVNLDDDAGGVTVIPLSGLNVSETGTSDTFSLVLNGVPGASVTINLTSSDPSEGTVSPASVTFTRGNWNVPQIVTVTGVDDPVDDGDVAFTIVTSSTMSTSALDNALVVADVDVTTTDNDTAGIIVTPISGLVTTEAGGTATFSIVLTSQPTSLVSVSAMSNDTSEAHVVASGYVLGGASWDVPLVVTVVGVDDTFDDGDKAFSIVTTTATSGDPLYNGLVVADISATNTDDDTATLSFTSTGLTTSENGGFTVVTLDFNCGFEQTAMIDVHVSDTTEALLNGIAGYSSVAPGGTQPFSWPLILGGVDDLLADGDQPYTLDVVITTPEVGYAGQNLHIALTNLDNDTGEIIVSPAAGLAVTDQGATTTFQVLLAHAPTGNVSIGLSSSDTAEMTVAPASLTFTSGNWATPQSVTVTGVADAVQDGDQVRTIVTAAAVSTDLSYSGLNASDVSVTNVDSQTARVVSVYPNYRPGYIYGPSWGGRSLSTDGRYAIYTSNDAMIIPGDTNAAPDTILRDRLLGTNSRVSVASGGVQATGNDGVMSADARYFAFRSNLATVVPGDTNGVGDIFVFDRVANTTQRASLRNDGSQLTDYYGGAYSISANGRYVAFSTRDAAVPTDTNGRYDVYFRDLMLGTTTRASLKAGGTQITNDAVGPVEVSNDGRYVAFSSYGNFTSTPVGNVTNIYMRDLVSDTVTLVSHDASGNPSPTSVYSMTMSPDGRYVAFTSDSPLLPSDTNAKRDIYVWDRITNTSIRASVSTGGAQATRDCDSPSISDDGQRIVFMSASSIFAADDMNNASDVFVRDLATNTTTLVSRTTSGAVLATGAYQQQNNTTAWISGDGHVVEFVANSPDAMTAGYQPTQGSRVYAVTVP